MTLVDMIVVHYRGADMPHKVFCVKKINSERVNDSTAF